MQTAADNEVWLPILGYEGRYEVSSLGRVRSLPRSRTKGGFLALPPDSHGRPHVTLHKDGGQKVAQVHRLVANAFHGPLPPGMETRHLDGNPTNNVATNLVYGTRSENQRDSVQIGTHNETRKTHCPAGHPYDDENTYVDPIGNRHCRACRRDVDRRRTIQGRHRGRHRRSSSAPQGTTSAPLGQPTGR